MATALGAGLVATVVVGLGATVIATMGFPSGNIDLESQDGARSSDGAEALLERSANVASTALIPVPTSAPTTTAVPTTSTTEPEPTPDPTEELVPLVAVNGLYAGVPAVADEDPAVDSEDQATTKEAEDQEWAHPTSIVSPSSAPPQRLGHFVVIDDLILTSASMIKGHDDLHLVIDGIWVPVEVHGRDPLTDLALLRPIEGGPSVDLAPVRMSWTVDDNGFAMPDIGSPVYVHGIEERVEGVFVGPKDRAVTATGEPIYSAYLTTVHRPDGSSGSALTNDEGLVIGLVVNSPDYLASVVSVETMLDVGSSMLEWGRPALEWLGFETESSKEGGVAVLMVEDDSPGAEAGLRAGDRIRYLDGVAVLDREHLTHLVRRAGVDATLTLVIERDGRQLGRTLTVGRLEPLNGAE